MRDAGILLRYFARRLLDDGLRITACTDDEIDAWRRFRAIEAVDVTMAQAASGDYQGVLVRITDGELTDNAYDCSVDGNCNDGSGNSAVVVFDYGDSDWDNRIGDSPLSGVMIFRFEREQIMPRNGADFP